ncbi:MULTISPECIES: TonB-dependent receptor domain-containing protein [unclassified Shewanella]|jgi:iron complex outermembrane receptor protein|uniref:TonB-dependent receptor domain-containing protein n=1 Tax=Shewanella TaxID=22 RepID=UPI0018E31F8B|nr:MULTISPECIES: TonB-dependent receptor [unclassified Shewanella]MBI1673654.1 TonB-dependent receptor [Shewanella sp. DW31]MCU7962841.1 TonB-dependent receptor [Shewanella sp. SW32]MCU7970737.1 TonB-dependent receptor [Shewanella sp. SW29]MCU8093603.1 TonB-dependent receptor [Shewanella sp. SM20]
MHKNNLLAKSVRFALISGVTATTLSTFGVFAAEEDGAKVERIEVTGSRIKRTDMETTVPITVLSREDIAQTGAINVADILNSSPVTIAGSDQSNSAFTTSTVGLNTTSLRNLGDSRTLVLVNGRRFVSGVDPSSGYAVDLNAIPTSMIERIEILKSASSAIYGSDAVAGVVNIITRKDFDGVEVNAQTGISGESDRNTKTVSLTSGKTWSGGNAWVSLGYDDDEGIKATDRDFSKQDLAVFLDENGNEYAGPLNSSFAPQGKIGKYNGDGTLYSGATGSFNRAEYRQLVTPLERKYAAAGLNMELADNVSMFTELNWNTTKTIDSTIEPTPLDVVNDVWLKNRNGKGGMDINSPLIPDALRNALVADGITNLNQTTFTRRLVEFGPRSTDLERNTIRIATGVDWAINDAWASQTYMTWGRTDQLQDNGGQVNKERAALALDVIKDANGNLVCANELARLQGCVPLDLFGAGTVSDEAVKYIESPAKAAGQAEQFVLGSSVTGALPVALPGGDIGVAMGLEYREERGVYSPGDLAQTGASSTNQSDPTDGKLYSKDVYVEAILPVLENLEFDLAARFADHSVTGGDWTWNAGLEYTPFDSFKVRASAATAIRTPNISDLYGGRGETFATVADPCDGVTATTAGNAAANCRAIQSVSDRIAADGVFKLTQAERQATGGTQGGNPDVKAETADTWSAGIIWQIVDDLAFTLDYYDISVKDAISTTSRTTVLNRCFDVDASQFSQNCNGAAVRDFKGALIEVHSGTSNENNIDTSGIDAEFNYTTDLGPGSFKAQLVWNYTNEYVVTGILSGEAIDYVGDVTHPEHRANLNLSYALDEMSFAWRMRYWDAVVDSVDESNGNFTDGASLTTFNEIDAVIYHDVNASYTFANGWEAMVGVRNLFDKQPPLLPQGSNSGSTGINTASEAYDVTGRYFYAGVTAKF